MRIKLIYTLNELSELTGVSRKSIEDWFKEHGVPVEHQGTGASSYVHLSSIYNNWREVFDSVAIASMLSRKLEEDDDLH